MNTSRLFIYYYPGLVLLLWLLFQVTYSLAHYSQYQQDSRILILNIEKRIALDMEKIRLANKALNTVAHEPSVKEYMLDLNKQLANENAPAILVQLQNIQLTVHTALSIYVSELNPSGQLIAVHIGVFSWSYLSSLSPFAPLLAVFFAFSSHKLYLKKKPEVGKTSKNQLTSTQVRLIVNLHNKTLNNALSGVEITLPNKPFCFYVALLEYCVKEPQPYLSQTKNVPDDIISLANKHFYRLIELGHTKRKRPDFSTNLDKTLSEIRAALDALFLIDSKDKEIFYPPRAQGEGSRSTHHNYALQHIDKDQLEIIGK
jgi:hypothetical protein